MHCRGNEWVFNAVLVKTVSGMSKTNMLLPVLLLVIAVPSKFALSAHSWYCHRLVPRFITYTLTPCTYPCLVVSSHVHPHIVVQNEPDGTPCTVQTGFHHKREFGMCRSSVCTTELHHKILKRKKRFVFLYAIPRIFKLRKESRDLQNKIRELKAHLATSRNTDIGNEEERLHGRGSGRIGVGNNGLNNGVRFGPEYDGDVGSGTTNLHFSEGGSATPEIYPAGRPAFGATSDDGIETGASDYLPNGYNERGSFGTAGTGTEDGMVLGQAKLG